MVKRWAQMEQQSPAATKTQAVPMALGLRDFLSAICGELPSCGDLPRLPNGVDNDIINNGMLGGGVFALSPEESYEEG